VWVWVGQCEREKVSKWLKHKVVLFKENVFYRDVISKVYIIAPVCSKDLIIEKMISL